MLLSNSTIQINSSIYIIHIVVCKAEFEAQETILNVPIVINWLQLQLHCNDAGMCSYTEDRVSCAAAWQHAVQTGEELGPSNHA